MTEDNLFLRAARKIFDDERLPFDFRRVALRIFDDGRPPFDFLRVARKICMSPTAIQQFDFAIINTNSYLNTPI